MRIEILQTGKELRDLQADWEGLAQRSASPNPFLGYGWSLACLEDIPESSQPFIISVWSDEGLAGIAPMRIDTSEEGRTLCFLASNRSDYLGLLLSRDSTSADECLLHEIIPGALAWDRAVLGRISRSSRLLSLAQERAGCLVSIRRDARSYHFYSKKHWEAVLKEGPAWLHQMDRALGRWKRAGGSIERHRGQTAAEFVQLVTAIEAESWKGLAGLGRFQSLSAQSFLRTALANCPDLELWFAWRQGRAVAYAINFILPDRIWLYQGGYLPSERKYSPGGLIDFCAIRQAWRQGQCHEYDYLCGDEPYKLERTNGSREFYKLWLE